MALGAGTHTQAYRLRQFQETRHAPAKGTYAWYKNLKVIAGFLMRF